MSRTRRVLMVAFVAAALCADKVVAAAPSVRALDAVAVARQFAGRLAVSFRRVVAAQTLHQVRRLVMQAAELRFRVFVETRAANHSPSPTHRYRLPPPARL